MCKYTAVLSKRAEKTLDSLSDHVATPLLHAIASLEENPRPHGYRKLRGRDAFRIRAGNYRIIYEIIDDKLIVVIVTVGHRKDVYE